MGLSFENPKSYEAQTFLTQVIEQTDQDKTPQAVHRTVLANLLDAKGHHSYPLYEQYMDWLV
ncbi:hypothetical protein [Endozoicomonas sp. 2B-B]